MRPSFFWLWAPLHFAHCSVFFHVNADDRGRPWNTRAVLCEDGAEPEDMLHCAAPRMEVVWQEGLRHAEHAVLHADFPGRPMEISFSPLPAAEGGFARFQMRGVGYPGSSWPHGAYKGELAVAREDIQIGASDPAGMENLHIQAPCRVTLREANGPDQRGIGILEQLVLGAYAPYGFS
jgi:hypothetical protein